MRHTPYIVVGIAFRAERRSVTTHEVLSESVDEARTVGEQIGLTFPGEKARGIPYADELEVA